MGISSEQSLDEFPGQAIAETVATAQFSQIGALTLVTTGEKASAVAVLIPGEVVIWKDESPTQVKPESGISNCYGPKSMRNDEKEEFQK